jgi:hypothetical protein
VELLEYVIGEDDRHEEEAVREERGVLMQPVPSGDHAGLQQSRVNPADCASKGVYGMDRGDPVATGTLGRRVLSPAGF